MVGNPEVGVAGLERALFAIELTRSAGERMAGELPPCRAAARPLAVLLGCLTAPYAPAFGAFPSRAAAGGAQSATKVSMGGAL
jgi:hypothetical protein